jgi:hypothetical protein
MNCQRCDSERILRVCIKNNDCFNAEFMGRNFRFGSYPYVKNIVNGDYTEPDICLECGQVQGKFPIGDLDDDCFEKYCSHGNLIGDCLACRSKELVEDSKKEFEGVPKEVENLIKASRKMQEKEMTDMYIGELQNGNKQVRSNDFKAGSEGDDGQ